MTLFGCLRREVLPQARQAQSALRRAISLVRGVSPRGIAIIQHHRDNVAGFGELLAMVNGIFPAVHQATASWRAVSTSNGLAS